MAKINQDVRDIVESAKLCFAATICPDGSPSLSPKGSLRVWDDEHVVFMDIDSPNTIANLRRDPRMEINVIDFIKRRGYRLKGAATICEPGTEEYESVREWLLGLHGPAYPANRAVKLHVDRALPVLSPAYTFGKGNEQDIAQGWANIYRLPGSENAHTAKAADVEG